MVMGLQHGAQLEATLLQPVTDGGSGRRVDNHGVLTADQNPDDVVSQHRQGMHRGVHR